MKNRNQGAGKRDFSNAPAVTSSLADKLRARGLVPAASDGSTPAPTATPEPATTSPPRVTTATPTEASTRGEAATSARPNAASPGKPSAPDGPLVGCGKIVVRMERKGHGGKTVTVIDGLTPLDARVREATAKALGRALGCGARVEGLTIVLQGDHRERAEPLVRQRGAKVVVVG